VVSGGSLVWGKFSWLSFTLAVGIQVTKLHIKDARREAVTMLTSAGRLLLMVDARREMTGGGGGVMGEWLVREYWSRLNRLDTAIGSRAKQGGGRNMSARPECSGTNTSCTRNVQAKSRIGEKRRRRKAETTEYTSVANSYKVLWRAARILAAWHAKESGSKWAVETGQAGGMF
jgi:hypothetical protein